MVWPASTVCRVLSTRWPVSAALKAILMVSRSRISPTRMTLGAWRRAARKPLEKLSKSVPNSRWLKVATIMRMNKLDRVFQRDDVDGPGVADLVEHRGQGGGFAGARRAGDEHQAGLFTRNLFDDLRESSATPGWG